VSGFVNESVEFVKELYDFWGSGVVRCCCEKLVAEARNSSGTQRKRNVRLWKPLLSNGQ
jgi:hypothetical protein